MTQGMPERWDGTTYHGRSPLKSAPFDPWMVGGYVFLAGLSGASAIIGAIAAGSGRGDTARLVRRGRWLSLAAPVFGAPLLVADLHTPKRFYNMLRVAKGTSPMSIGTWILSAFSGFAFLAFADQPRAPGWLRWTGRASAWPAALTGAGLCSYTASLLAATSTPLWAASPRALAVRFASSSIATGAAALALGEERRGLRQRLDALAAMALAVELAATVVSGARARRVGAGPALRGGWGLVERAGGTGVGLGGPLALHAVASVVDRRRSGRGALLARWLTLIGSVAFRVSILGAGAVSASRPDVAFRFTEPRNLPRA